MNFSDMINNIDFNPFRIAVIFAVIFLIAYFSNSTNGQTAMSYPEWTTSFDEAIEKAEEMNAPVMLFFEGSDWCPWSKKLTTEVFRSPEFAAWMDAKLVPVLVDFPRTKALPGALANQNNNLLSRYRPHLTGFPTALFVNTDGTVIGKLGYEEGGVHKWTFEAQKIVGKLDKLAFAEMANIF